MAAFSLKQIFGNPESRRIEKSEARILDAMELLRSQSERLKGYQEDYLYSLSTFLRGLVEHHGFYVLRSTERMPLKLDIWHDQSKPIQKLALNIRTDQAGNLSLMLALAEIDDENLKREFDFNKKPKGEEYPIDDWFDEISNFLKLSKRD